MQEANQSQTSWVNQRTKSELIEIAGHLKLEASVTLDDLRRTIRRFLREHPEMTTDARDLSRSGPTSPLSANPPSEPVDTAEILSQVRKMGCTFDGRDPIVFLERLEEIREGHPLIGDNLLKGFPEIMKGGALLWYRNQRNTWHSWNDFQADFRRRYLPPLYSTRLIREVENRMQRPGERYPEYEAEIVTLMRRAGKTDEDEQLEILYDNMHPDYKIYIRRREATTRAELSELAIQFEIIQEQRKLIDTKTETKSNNTRRQVIATAQYDRRTCCWRCKQRGHTRSQCQRPAKLFCSQCGKDGVMTRHCHPPPGNAQGVGGTLGSPRPFSEQRFTTGRDHTPT